MFKMLQNLIFLDVSANALAEISVDHLDVGMKTQVTLAGLEAFVDEQGLSSSTAELVNDQVQTTSTSNPRVFYHQKRK